MNYCDVVPVSIANLLVGRFDDKLNLSMQTMYFLVRETFKLSEVNKETESLKYLENW